jgi:hypothetical protein
MHSDRHAGSASQKNIHRMPEIIPVSKGNRAMYIPRQGLYEKTPKET